MKSLDDGPAKQALIDQMVAIVRRDAPWTMGFFPYSSAAAQEWVHNFKSSVLIGDKGRYLRLDVPQRVADLKAWNRPVWWPLGLLAAAAAALLALGRRHLRRRERTNARGEVLA